MSAEFRSALLPHPAVPTPVGLAVVVAGRTTNAQLELEYHFEGAAAPDVSIAARAERPTRRDELWQHTCGEVFLADAARPEYLEFNFSPSGDWAAYSFTGLRSGRRDHHWQGPAPVVRWHVARHVLQVALPWQAIESAGTLGASYAAAYTAVVANIDGTRSFWALQHVRPTPDFHARASFVAQISRPVGEVS